jgi:ABC-type branched-subunit amino acid transport system substrate-binding protein
MKLTGNRFRRTAVVATALAALILFAAFDKALAAEPIKIGFSMALTGAYAGNGKAALLATQLWTEDQNAKGGLLARQVQLVYYDDQSNPSLVPGIYTKLFDIDKVDIVISGYGTNIIGPAMPLVMQHDKVFMSLAGLRVNEQFRYDKYFQIFPFGPDAHVTFAQGFFDVAMTMNPKPKTAAISVADSEFPQTAVIGAREWGKKFGLKVVYDRSFPPNQVDFGPIVRAIQAASPDIVYIACFPPNAVGLVRAVRETGFKPMLIGGGMVGPQYASVKQQLGALLNGFLSFETFVPEPTPPRIFPALKSSLDVTSRKPWPPVSMHLVTICRRSPMPACRYSLNRSKHPKASIRVKWPTTSTRRRTRRLWATSASAQTANGRSRGSSRCNTRRSMETAWSSSSSREPRSFCFRRPTSPARSSIRFLSREASAAVGEHSCASAITERSKHCPA